MSVAAEVNRSVARQSVAEMMDMNVIRRGHTRRHDRRCSLWYFHSHPMFFTGRLWSFVQDLPSCVPATVLDTIDAVTGPQFAGNLIAQGLVNVINSKGTHDRKQVKCVPIERKFLKVGRDLGKESFAIRKYYRDQLSGLKVLLADDALESGGTRIKCLRVLEAAGAEFVASVSFADLSIVPVENHYSLWKPPANEIYEIGCCPLCKAGVLFDMF